VQLLLHRLHQAVAQRQAANTCHQSLAVTMQEYFSTRAVSGHASVNQGEYQRDSWGRRTPRMPMVLPMVTSWLESKAGQGTNSA